MSTHVSIHMSTHVSARMSIHVSVRMSIHVSIHVHIVRIHTSDLVIGNLLSAEVEQWRELVLAGQDKVRPACTELSSFCLCTAHAIAATGIFKRQCEPSFVCSMFATDTIRTKSCIGS